MSKRKDKRKDLKFNGWDWTELLVVWPPHKSSKMRAWPKDDEMLARDIIEGHLATISGYLPDIAGKMSPDKKWELRQVRRWAQAVARNSRHTCQPILKAIAYVECDHAFLGWVRDTLRVWWT